MNDHERTLLAEVHGMLTEIYRRLCGEPSPVTTAQHRRWSTGCLCQWDEDGNPSWVVPSCPVHATEERRRQVLEIAPDDDIPPFTQTRRRIPPPATDPDEHAAFGEGPSLEDLAAEHRQWMAERGYPSSTQPPTGDPPDDPEERS